MGYTLVEALAAGVILAASAGVLGRIVSGTMESMRVARDVQRAAQLLDQTLTKIDTIGPQRLLEEGPADGAFPPPDGQFRWRAAIESRLGGHLYEVTVHVSWPTDRGVRTVSATTLLNDPPQSRSGTVRWDQL